jgi:hypothetical protein
VRSRRGDEVTAARQRRPTGKVHGFNAEIFLGEFFQGWWQSGDFNQGSSLPRNPGLHDCRPDGTARTHQATPRLSKACRASFPETSGSLGMDQRSDLKRGNNRPALCRFREFGEIKLRRLIQIGQGFPKRFALCRRSRFCIVGHEPIAIRVGIYDGSKVESFLSLLHRG